MAILGDLISRGWKDDYFRGVTLGGIFGTWMGFLSFWVDGPAPWYAALLVPIGWIIMGLMVMPLLVRVLDDFAEIHADQRGRDE